VTGAVSGPTYELGNTIHTAPEDRPVGAAYQREVGTQQVFGAADELFGALKTKLTSAEVMSSSHSEVERLLDAEGRELLRTLYESHLTLRSQASPGTVVVGEDGVERTHRRVSGRTLMGLFGMVAMVRLGLSARGADSRFPVDAELNLPPTRHSLEVRRRAVIAASQMSFDQVVEHLATTTGAPVAKRQVEELVVEAAKDFEAFYESTVLDVPAESTGELLVLSFDMKGIVMRREDLRPSTRKAAATSRRKLGTRLTKGEKRNRKRMAMVAAVYTLDRWRRGPEDILRALRPARDAAAPPRPRPQHKRVWASVERDPEAVIREAFDEAITRDPELRKRWVVLVDGDPRQLAHVERIAKELEIEVTPVLDVIHVIEYLWKAGHVLHKEGSRQLEEWVTERLHRVLDGKASRVAAGMRQSATKRGLSKASRKAVDTCANYLLRYKALVRYDTFLAEGMPIATGVIEGACRHLVRDRMDITGARWRLPRAEAVLKIRSLRSSGDFEDYWAFHEHQEFLRNHASRYRDGRPPDLVRASPRAHLRLVT